MMRMRTYDEDEGGGGGGGIFLLSHISGRAMDSSSPDDMTHAQAWLTG
jgi:hypothetical protein